MSDSTDSECCQRAMWGGHPTKPSTARHSPLPLATGVRVCPWGIMGFTVAGMKNRIEDADTGDASRTSSGNARDGAVLCLQLLRVSSGWQPVPDPNTDR